MEERTMILRTVYLPPKMDKQLRHLAFKLNVAKNEIIRRMIAAGLQAEAKSKPTKIRVPKKRKPPVRVKQHRSIEHALQQAAAATLESESQRVRAGTTMGGELEIR